MLSHGFPSPVIRIGPCTSELRPIFTPALRSNAVRVRLKDCVGKPAAISAKKRRESSGWTSSRATCFRCAQKTLCRFMGVLTSKGESRRDRGRPAVQRQNFTQGTSADFALTVLETAPAFVRGRGIAVRHCRRDYHTWPLARQAAARRSNRFARAEFQDEIPTPALAFQLLRKCRVVRSRGDLTCCEFAYPGRAK